MDKVDVEGAATLLLRARTSGMLLDELPDRSRPRSAAEAYAIQLATVERLSDGIAGWKVAAVPDHGTVYGILLRSRVFGDDATVTTAGMSMIGVEAEVAFRCDRALPPRTTDYSYDEVAAAVTAFPAIEVLDTRFRDFDGTPVIVKAADFMANSAFVGGLERRDWRSFDLSRLEARLVVDGQEIVRTVGGHASGDALLPAIALVNVLRQSTGLPAGTVVTTGTYTGFRRVKAGSVVEADFPGFGRVRCRFDKPEPA